MASRPDGIIRAFGITGLQISASMSRIERKYAIELGHENSIRKLVDDIMVDAGGVDWWHGERVDEKGIREPAAGRRKKEIDSGITPRSERLLDYTTFGELS